MQLYRGRQVGSCTSRVLRRLTVSTCCNIALMRKRTRIIHPLQPFQMIAARGARHTVAKQSQCPVDQLSSVIFRTRVVTQNHKYTTQCSCYPGDGLEACWLHWAGAERLSRSARNAIAAEFGTEQECGEALANFNELQAVCDSEKVLSDVLSSCPALLRQPTQAVKARLNLFLQLSMPPNKVRICIPIQAHGHKAASVLSAVPS